jgi:hypothetical protein
VVLRSEPPIRRRTTKRKDVIEGGDASEARYAGHLNVFNDEEKLAARSSGALCPGCVGTEALASSEDRLGWPFDRCNSPRYLGVALPDDLRQCGVTRRLEGKCISRLW